MSESRLQGVGSEDGRQTPVVVDPHEKPIPFDGGFSLSFFDVALGKENGLCLFVGSSQDGTRRGGHPSVRKQKCKRRTTRRLRTVVP